MKLFTIGDSVAQGFMSLASAQTHLAFPTILNEAMQRVAETKWDYEVPYFKYDGHPISLEVIFRELEYAFGDDDNIRRLEWYKAFKTIDHILDKVEAYYEKGKGDENTPILEDGEFLPNIAARGFNVADAWLVNAKLAYKKIKKSERWYHQAESRINNMVPSESFFRNAQKMLNPTLNPDFNEFTQLDWLNYHHNNTQEGVENFIIMLGGNNALGTVTRLDLTPTDKNFDLNNQDWEDRKDYNLWLPNHFEAEYEMLLNKVDYIMSQRTDVDWKVYIGTVPLLTILPLFEGFGNQNLGYQHDIPDEHVGTQEEPYYLRQRMYYEGYTYYSFGNDENGNRRVKRPFKSVSMEDAIKIDNYILQYNSSIRKLVKHIDNGRGKYHIVDVSNTFDELAIKRNNYQRKYKLPKEYQELNPVPDVRFYNTVNGKLDRGGLFSLDGIHPSSMGHGILAYEFAKVMDPSRRLANEIDYSKIINNDNLHKYPLKHIDEIFENNKLINFFANLMSSLL